MSHPWADNVDYFSSGFNKHEPRKGIALAHFTEVVSD